MDKKDPWGEIEVPVKNDGTVTVYYCGEEYKLDVEELEKQIAEEKEEEQKKEENNAKARDAVACLVSVRNAVSLARHRHLTQRYR
ncbi:MAG: hypothetical protein FWE64_04190 [Alphaproteobacteria bacterium]|nr:hypothetical protein [Alphaproteobacteria bacterium]